MPRLKINILFIAMLTSFTACAQQHDIVSLTPGTDNSISTSGIEKEILGYINQYRKSIGKNSLQMIDAASKQAAMHSADMAKGKTPFGHNGFEDRVIKIGVYLGSVHGAAENVAFGQLTAREVVDGWLNSPGHKKNIQGDYTFTGIGVAKDKMGNIFFTQIFLKK